METKSVWQTYTKVRVQLLLAKPLGIDNSILVLQNHEGSSRFCDKGLHSTMKCNSWCHRRLSTGDYGVILAHLFFAALPPHRRTGLAALTSTALTSPHESRRTNP